MQSISVVMGRPDVSKVVGRRDGVVEVGDAEAGGLLLDGSAALNDGV